uniref:Uncharacterized protein n=1 Tax=Parastrongyloides trichosuri TaxID=131310 RepID=A0A0N4ZTS2_PARTI
MPSNKPSQESSTDSNTSEVHDIGTKKLPQQNICTEKESVPGPITTNITDNLSLPLPSRQFIRHQLSATEEEHSSDDEESLILRKKIAAKTKKEIKPISQKSSDSLSIKPPKGNLLRPITQNIETLSQDMTSTVNSGTTPANPSPTTPQKSIHNRFAGAHASFRIRMLQEQHGVKKVGEPVSYYNIYFIKFKNNISLWLLTSFNHKNI